MTKSYRSSCFFTEHLLTNLQSSAEASGTFRTAMGIHLADLWPLVEYFYNLVSWLERANAVLPNHVMTGFAVSFTVCCLLFLPILYTVLRMVWAISEVGPARKSMTTFFIVCLGVPLYPVLTALLLALLWLGIGCSMLILSSFGPAALLFWLFVRLWELKTDFVEAENEKMNDLERGPQPVEDITCWELVCGLLIGILSCCSFGMLLGQQSKCFAEGPETENESNCSRGMSCVFFHTCSPGLAKLPLIKAFMSYIRVFTPIAYSFYFRRRRVCGENGI